MFEKNILIPFLDSLRNYSGRNAFLIDEIEYSYEMLARSISKIRSQIQNIIFSGEHIGLMANDDLETYAAIFAIWLEGKAYVPLHPAFPLERRMQIIKDAEIDLIIDSSGHLEETGVNLIKSNGLTFTKYNLEPKIVGDDQLAYILYTSGSTGKPKGVPISRTNLAAFIQSFNKIGIDINEEDRCLQYFDLTFDISIQSYLVPLLKGACIYTIPPDRIKPMYTYELMEEHMLTFAPTPPSMVRYLRPYFDEIHLPHLKTNILCAEASAVQLIEEWKECIPNAKILNLYGPTEATIYCTYSEFHRDSINKELNGMMTIGQPLSGVKVMVIDEDLKELPKNQNGELCVSGNLVTQGYWKNDERNKNSFFTRLIDDKVYRFYRTGDSCYIDDDDDIMLAGRLDHQVKVQGYRIELGEIESHARDFVEGANAVAIIFENKQGLTEIALVIEGVTYNQYDLEKFLRTKLPSYMIPTQYHMMDSFPINMNGKVDRISLKGNLIF